MNDIITLDTLPPSSLDAINFVKDIEAVSGAEKQIDIETEHVLHDGIYTRTICVPAGVMITGALIKIPTTLIVSGECLVLIGDGDGVIINGFKVIPAEAGRKQVFVASTDTYISMYFKTKAKTVEEAEEEFTDETDMLKSRVNKNKLVMGV